MDPSKREQAIDLKIKLLREKNQQIEQRHKLIEEDKKLISYFFLFEITLYTVEVLHPLNQFQFSRSFLTIVKTN